MGSVVTLIGDGQLANRSCFDCYKRVCSVCRLRTEGLLCYMKCSGKYIETNFKMKIPFQNTLP